MKETVSSGVIQTAVQKNPLYYKDKNHKNLVVGLTMESNIICMYLLGTRSSILHTQKKHVLC